MTVTESRPEHVEGTLPGDGIPGGGRDAGGWLDATDHKRVGVLFLYAALAFLIVGGAGGMLLRGELAGEGVQLLEGDYGRTFSLHATVLTLLFLPPFWSGLSTFLVPLQIGSNRVAFPRLIATAFWLYAAGGILLLATYAMEGLSAVGFTVSTAVASPPDGASTADDLWLASVALVAIAAFLVAVTLVVTVARLRAVGLVFSRLPLFTWSAFGTALVLVLSTPVFLGGLLLLYIDQHYGGEFFATNGSAVVWQHTLWLFGRPEAYLLVLPGLGAACEIVATHARRPLLSFTVARTALLAVAGLSVTAWAAGTKVADALVVPTYSPLTALVAVPLALLAAVWAGTLATGRPRLHPSLLLVAGALLLFGLAALNAAIAAVVEVHGTAWTTGFLHATVFAPPLLLAVASLYHWAPKLWGRHLSAGTGALVALLLLGGSVLDAGASFLLGYSGADWHVDDLSGGSGWLALSRLGTTGGILLVVGLLLLVVEVIRAAARGADPGVGADPFGGFTLEWATSSPPPARNFDALPPIGSAHPLADAAGGTEEVTA